MNHWTYYNHALISTLAPHESPDTSLIGEKLSWWKATNGRPLLARWTTNFDCPAETAWWYVVKDTPFDLSALKAKRRYEINKGLKNFDVHLINPCDFKKELFEVQVAAFSAYPPKYRPTVIYEEFVNGVKNWSDFTIFGAFTKNDNKLVGYALLEPRGEQCMKFSIQKTMPAYEKSGVNAALVYAILNHFLYFLSNGGYICDGERSINHETAFQDYLEKYFGFRKAYCHLHIKYRPDIYWILRLLYPFRKVLLYFDGIGLIHSINAVLKMDEYAQSPLK